MPFPNFFILGSPKCGTTALASYLAEHPAVFFSPLKEPHFFSTDLPKFSAMKEVHYLSLFKGADPSRHRILGEGSTSYLFSRDAVPNILTKVPQARFLVMLRDPMEFFPSWHSHLLLNGWEDLKDPEEAWRAEADRREGKRVPSLCREPHRLLYSQWCRMGAQAARLFSVVPKDRVKVLLFDDFTRDTAGAYAQVLSFLGLPPDDRTQFPRINENRRARWGPLHSGLRLASRGIMALQGRFGFPRGLGLMNRLMGFTTTRAARKPLRLEFRRELSQAFQEDLALLARTLGRDLSRWSKA